LVFATNALIILQNLSRSFGALTLVYIRQYIMAQLSRTFLQQKPSSDPKCNVTKTNDSFPYLIYQT
jgi:hypothetical protein